MPRARAPAAVRGGDANGTGGSKEIKYRGVRKRPWGRFAAEIRDPIKKHDIVASTCKKSFSFDLNVPLPPVRAAADADELACTALRL